MNANGQLRLLAVVSPALVAGLFDHYFFNLNFPHMVGLLWLLLGLLVVLERICRSSEPGASDRLAMPTGSPAAIP